jgi:UPF0755 protein
MKVLLTVLLLVLLAAAGAGAWLWVSVTQPYQNFPAEGVFVEVPHGASCRTVSRLLAREGVVRSALAFQFYCRRHPRRRLQAGEYFFDRAVSGRDVFWTLASGKVFEKPFVVREGLTMFEIARELESAGFVSAGAFLQAAQDPALIRDLAPGAQTLEGFLFPATYLFPRHPAATAVTSAMVGKFKEQWARIVPGGAASGKTGGSDPAGEDEAASVESIVTLASLVERETPQPDERPLVASVYDNRLRKRMLLQCDPTVIYALERDGSYSGKLTLGDLRVDSPYNTYRNRGLPPGPIGNPGEAALRAALAPAHSDYLYFVANTHGGHFFGKTLAEHNRNVLRYHRLLAGLPDIPEPAVSKRHAPPRHKHRASNSSRSRGR